MRSSAESARTTPTAEASCPTDVQVPGKLPAAFRDRLFSSNARIVIMASRREAELRSVAIAAVISLKYHFRRSRVVEEKSCVARLRACWDERIASVAFRVLITPS